MASLLRDSSQISSLKNSFFLFQPLITWSGVGICHYILNLHGQKRKVKQFSHYIYKDTLSEEQTLQLLRQNPREPGDPTMYRWFFTHSPAAAQAGQLTSRSTQLAVNGVPSKGLTWIHLVADHFSPSMTAQLPCRLAESAVPSWSRLKNNSASPFLGFTVWMHEKRRETLKSENFP